MVTPKEDEIKKRGEDEFDRQVREGSKEKNIRRGD